MRPFRISIQTLPYKCERLNFQIDSFRWRWYEKQLPVKYDHKTFGHLNTIPAIADWVKPYKAKKDRSQLGPFALAYDYLDLYGDTIVPIERTVWAEGRKTWDVKRFERFEAPLSFFLEWTKQKLRDTDNFSPNESLYIAQCPISSLPKTLREDLPAPVYCTSQNGKLTKKQRKRIKMNGIEPYQGATENSSIWMGIPPNETPLHKDPNSNFLVQVAGWKTVRLMKPDDGQLVLEYAKRDILKLGQAQGASGRLDMSMRGEEMMVGPERGLMTELVWGQSCSTPGTSLAEKVTRRTIDAKDGKDETMIENEDEEVDTTEVVAEESKPSQSIEAYSNTNVTAADIAYELEDAPRLNIFETHLAPGDALFIPQGWYHSVRSVGNHTHGINISANWWFRFKMASNIRAAGANVSFAP